MKKYKFNEIKKANKVFFSKDSVRFHQDKKYIIDGDLLTVIKPMSRGDNAVYKIHPNTLNLSYHFNLTI